MGERGERNMEKHDMATKQSNDKPPLCQNEFVGLKLLAFLSVANNFLFQFSPDKILIGWVKIKASHSLPGENSIIDISAPGKLALAGQWLFQQKINVSTAWWQNGRHVLGNIL